KLPFAPPDDPVVRARAEALRARGGDPFRELQLPEAAMALKQGVGRLIRSEKDRGVLVIGDRRLLTRPYGKTLLRSLPPFGLTRSVESVVEFIRQGEASATPATTAGSPAESRSPSPGCRENWPPAPASRCRAVRPCRARRRRGT